MTCRQKANAGLYAILSATIMTSMWIGSYVAPTRAARGGPVWRVGGNGMTGNCCGHAYGYQAARGCGAGGYAKPIDVPARHAGERQGVFFFKQKTAYEMIW